MTHLITKSSEKEPTRNQFTIILTKRDKKLCKFDFTTDKMTKNKNFKVNNTKKSTYSIYHN